MSEKVIEDKPEIDAFGRSEIKPAFTGAYLGYICGRCQKSHFTRYPEEAIWQDHCIKTIGDFRRYQKGQQGMVICRCNCGNDVRIGQPDLLDCAYEKTPKTLEFRIENEEGEQ